MSAIKIYSNDSLWIVMWDHRPPGRFAPHDKICDILRAAIKSRISADMLSLRISYSVIIQVTYSLLHTCNFFQMLMQINRSNWGHLQKGALCPMLLYIYIYSCFLDASKAFDIVNHWVMLKKMKDRQIPSRPIIIRILLVWYREQLIFVKWGCCTSTR